MDCPQCQNDEIDASGTCPACGYQTSAGVSDPEPEPVATGNKSPAGGDVLFPDKDPGTRERIHLTLFIIPRLFHAYI